MRCRSETGVTLFLAEGKNSALQSWHLFIRWRHIVPPERSREVVGAYNWLYRGWTMSRARLSRQPISDSINL